MSRKINIFISYSHQDAEYLREDSLGGFLKGIQQDDSIAAEFWSDQRIATGESWDEEIKARIAESDIALVLVSQAFLNSSYCTDVEIGSFIARKVFIFPVILSACDWQRHKWLHSRQCLPGGEETVEEHYTEPGRRKRLFLKILQELRQRVEQIASQGPRRTTLLDTLKADMDIGPADNRFRLVKEIGGGGMGRIWLARDLEEEALEGSECYKALKVVNPLLRSDARALAALKREALRAARLSHPHIINVYGWRQGEDDWPFVVMDYLEGRDLDRLLLEEGQPGLRWERTLELLRPMADALDYAHKSRLIHRDLKPSNVFITTAGELKLLDFGLAYQLRHSRHLVAGQDMDSGGTPEYMPPEAFAAGQPHPAQDIYALACMAYELLTGEPPYKPAAAVQRNPQLLPDKPDALNDTAWAVLKSGFAYRREDRPTSAGELVRHLLKAQQAVVPDQFIHGWTTAQVQTLQQQVAEALGLPVVFRDKFRDGGEGPELVVIPGGAFTMGSSKNDKQAYEDEQPPHRVTVSTCYLMQFPVTRGLYQAVLGKGPSEWEERKDEKRLPANYVTWFDAVRFCNALSERCGLQPCYQIKGEQVEWNRQAEGYRLPTEAEWEYTVRAGTATSWFCGDDEKLLGRYAWYAENSSSNIHPVGEKEPNPWGLYDMMGNVWEWCWDWYGPYGADAVVDPVGPDGAGRRVLRGGAYWDEARNLRSALRLRLEPEVRSDAIGFRCVRAARRQPL
jgi:formylglycine-generating enzyme required for sulfatase activity